MDFVSYELTADALHLGERIKGNVLKPCLRTIPYSAITGALNREFSGPFDLEGIRAVGFLEEKPGRNRMETLIYSPRDRVAGLSKIPLQVEYLADVQATILLLANDRTTRMPKEFEITLGGMRSHGFGQARLKLREIVSTGTRPGLLRVRLPEEQVPTFGIVKVVAPVFGYLFKPTPGTFTGAYVRALFEDSRVVGPELLLEPKTAA